MWSTTQEIYILFYSLLQEKKVVLESSGPQIARISVFEVSCTNIDRMVFNVHESMIGWS